LIEVNAEKNYILVKGALPGPKKSIVMLRSPVRAQFRKPVVKELANYADKKGE
jgi:ribosomal protein L3